jgi:hypothetical protein
MTSAAASSITTAIVQLLDANPACNRSTVRWGDPVTRELSDKLSNQLGLPRQDLIPISTTPNSSGSIRIEHFAMSLLEEAQRSSAEESVRRLTKFLARNTAEELEVVAVWGFEPTAVVPLLDNISLQPFSSLPPSQAKEQLSALQSDNPFALTPKPQAAVVRQFTYGPIVDANLVPLAPSASASVDQTSQVETLLEIVRVMTLLVNGPVSAIGYWYQAASPVPIVNIGGGGGFETLRQFSFPGDQEAISGDQVELVRQYLALTDTHRSGLRIPLDRLNSAKLHLHAGHIRDSVLDLGIALEALLCSEDDPIELSYRFRVRGAPLRDGEFAMRKDTSAVLQALYKLRSKVAHGKPVTKVRVSGRPSMTDREGIRVFLREAIALAMELMQIVIRHGSLPDWERLVLTGTMTSIT